MQFLCTGLIDSYNDYNMMDVVTGDQVVEEELSDQEEVSFNNTILIFYKSFVSVVSYL